MLQDIPSELLVQLPCDERHGNGDSCEDARDADEDRLDIRPNVIIRKGVERLEIVDGFVDLIDLDGSVDEKREIGDAEADNLNRVLRLKSIPDQNEFVDETEQEQA